MLWRALSVIDPDHKAIPNVNPILPYDVPSESGKPNDALSDIKMLAQYGIGVFWSNGNVEYTKFFSKRFPDGTNGMRILFATSVLAEGIDYPCVKHVFIYAPPDIKFYVSNDLINRTKVLQMIGRCGRLESCASYVSNSLKDLVEG
jgi:superfamily II DNA/RNA helicase